MSDQSPSRLQELIEACLNKSLSDSQFDELSELVASDPNACKAYLQASHLHVCLEELVKGERQEADYRKIANRMELLAHGSSPPDVDATCDRPQTRSPWFASLVIGVAATAAAVLIGVYIANVGGDDPVENIVVAVDSPLQGSTEEVDTSPEVKQPVSPDLTSEDYVAQLVDASKDVVWDDKAMPHDLFLRLEAGATVSIVEGVVKIAFGDGAMVYMHGPASLTPLSRRSARLNQGRVLGIAENGNFALSTPTAEVIDYGTEFGVFVEPELGTEVCVFDGEVGVASAGSDAGESNELRLNEGMAVRIQRDGTRAPNAKIDRDSFSVHHNAFQSDLLPADQLSLLSVLANAPPRENPVAISIDPRDGHWDPRIPKDDRGRYRPSDGQYHPSDTSAAVDGVFIPREDGANVVVNSAGDKFSVERNDGVTWGPIWGRRPAAGLPAGGAFRGVVDEYWGKDTRSTIADCVESSRLGVIGIHPNVGITIDLRSIALRHDASASRLTADLANLDNFLTAGLRPHPKWSTRSANFRILVDGELRFERLDLQRSDGKVAIDVELHPQDRFLTLLSTDGGNSNWFDHIVLIDGVFDLKLHE